MSLTNRLRPARPLWLRYGIAVLAVAIALSIKLLLDPLFDVESPFLLFFAAVMVSSLYGGRGAGVLATVSAALISDYLFLSPTHSFFNPDLGQNVRLFLFVVEGLLISGTISALTSAKERIKSGQEALIQSEERYRLLVESAQDYAIFLLDPKGCVMSWNIGAQNLKGYRADEIIGQHFSRFYPEEDIERGKPDRYLEVAATVGRIEDEGWRIRKDGSRFWANVVMTALRDKAGNLQGFSKVTRDISERKRAEDALQNAYGELEIRVQERTAELSATNLQLQQQIKERQRVEEALRESERRFRAIFNQTFQFMGLMQPDGIVLEANQTALDFGGLQRSDVIGRPFWEARWWTISEQTQNQLRKAIALAASGEFVRYEVDVLGAGNTVATIDFSIKPIRDEAGQVVLLIPEGRDITSLKQAEAQIRQLNAELEQRVIERTAQLEATNRQLANEVTERDRTVYQLRQAQAALGETEQRFRATFNQAAVGIAQVGIDGRWLLVNQKLGDIVGYTQQELLERTFQDITYPDDLATDLEYVRQILANEIQTYSMEKRYIHKDGSLVWINLTVSLVREPNALDAQKPGEPKYFISVVEDISDRKQAEEALQRQSEELAQANRLKDEFLATLSHELRTPLNSILGWTKLLPSRRLNEATMARAMETISRNTQSLAQLIEDVLDMSNIITGQLNLKVSPVAPVPIIEKTIASIHSAAEAKSIQIQFHLDPTTGLILGDANRLQQIVWNLLSNAVKFTPKEGRIEVRLEPINDQAQIQVSDTGIGISAEFLPFVFDRFRQENGSITRSHGGLGMGLALVRYLVELQGGTVRAESRGQGQGATFTVSFPITIAQRSDSELSLMQSLVTDAVLKNGSLFLDNLRVLVVDDEADTRELLSVILEGDGAEVSAVATVREALETLQRFKPHVLVSDIGMPGENGYDLIRQVRALPPERGGKIPALALTAYAKIEDRNQALTAGFQMHVPKPVDPEELLVVVGQLAGRISRGKGNG